MNASIKHRNRSKVTQGEMPYVSGVKYNIILYHQSWIFGLRRIMVSEKRQNTRFPELQNVGVRDYEEIRCDGDALKPEIFSDGA